MMLHSVITKGRTCMAVLFSLMVLSSPLLYACEAEPPSPPDYDPDFQLIGPEADTEMDDEQDIVVPETECESGLDPVLFKTGEFILSRTDAAIDGIEFPFPVTRTYRSRPAPLIRNTINANGEPISEGDDGNPESIEGDSWLKVIEFPLESAIYTGPYRFQWKSPRNIDADFPIIVEFELTGPSDYQVVHNQGAVYDSAMYQFKLDHNSRSYCVTLTVTRGYPRFDCDNYGCTVIPGSYTWTETEYTYCFTIPGILPNLFHPYPALMGFPTPEHSVISRGNNNTILLAEDNTTTQLNWTPGWDMSYNLRLVEKRDPNTEITQSIRLYTGGGTINPECG